MNFMIYILISAFVLYSLRTIMIYFGSQSLRKKNDTTPSGYTPFVSIVVPARNEENNIGAALRSIADSNYPTDCFEIIAVNDRSTDNTLAVMQKLATEFPFIKIVNLTEARTEKNLMGKPGALHLGIEQAKGEIILMTDADCVVRKDWIATVADKFIDKELGLQASFTLIAGKRVFDIIQAVEWIYMHTMASAGMATDQPLGCYGNNLAIRRSVYQELGGYAKIPFSITEDMALEQQVFKLGKKINYLTKYSATVTTLPCKDLNEYMSQHRRWAIGGMGLGWRAVVFVITSFSIWAGLATAIIMGSPIAFATILLTRIVGDYLIINKTISVLNQKHLKFWIVPSIFFFMLIELIIPFTLLSQKVKWKDQIFSK